MKKISSLEELIEAIKDNHNDFFINFGIARSSKNITYDGNMFYIVNEIDGSDQTLDAKQLFNEDYTNIGKAIKQGQFYQY